MADERRPGDHGQGQQPRDPGVAALVEEARDVAPIGLRSPDWWPTRWPDRPLQHGPTVLALPGDTAGCHGLCADPDDDGLGQQASDRSSARDRTGQGGTSWPPARNSAGIEGELRQHVDGEHDHRGGSPSCTQGDPSTMESLSVRPRRRPRAKESTAPSDHHRDVDGVHLGVSDVLQPDEAHDDGKEEELLRSWAPLRPCHPTGPGRRRSRPTPTAIVIRFTSDRQLVDGLTTHLRPADCESEGAGESHGNGHEDQGIGEGINRDPIGEEPVAELGVVPVVGPVGEQEDLAPMTNAQNAP